MQPYRNESESGWGALVYGGTPGGIAAAVCAAREGVRTLLIVEGAHVGGMTASGLCTTDAVRRDAFGGILIEFVSHVRESYKQRYGPHSEQARLCREGWWYEPHVAEDVFDRMLEAQSNLTVRRRERLIEVRTSNRRIDSITTRTADGSPQTLTAETFIDASYEGDLMALAGVPYRVGRESRAEFGEPLAGVVYQDWRRGVLLPRSTGETHGGIQAYCARQTLTCDPGNQVHVEKPENYGAHLADYLPLLDDFASGRVTRFDQITMINPLPNQKIDANGHIEALTSFNLPGRNWDYPDASAVERAAIVQWHRDHARGLLWFVQNDPRVPESIQSEARKWQFCADEYPQDEHQPWQLYVRQARRMEGRMTLTQHDFSIQAGAEATPVHEDAIAVAEHSFDIHPCQDRSAAVDGWMEGVLWFPDKARGPAQPGQVPYRAMLPKNLDNLLVPVALSATHVAFSVLRMEPVWMTTGRCAGVAAAMAARLRRAVADIDVCTLQEALREGRDMGIVPAMS